MVVSKKPLMSSFRRGPPIRASPAMNGPRGLNGPPINSSIGWATGAMFNDDVAIDREISPRVDRARTCHGGLHRGISDFLLFMDRLEHMSHSIISVLAIRNVNGHQKRQGIIALYHVQSSAGTGSSPETCSSCCVSLEQMA